MELSKSFAIIGAGNGGQAFAAYLSLKGHSVKIYDVSQKTVDILQEKGGVLLEGNSDVVGFGKIMLASTDLKEVIRGADIVMVVLPSIYHKDMAEKMAPYLEDGQYGSTKCTESKGLHSQNPPGLYIYITVCVPCGRGWSCRGFRAERILFCRSITGK